MENIQYLSLDIMNNHVYEYAYAKQYDEGRILIFTVTENGYPYNLDDVSATFQMKKPDDTIILDSGIIEDNKIKINVTRQMTALQGKIPYQIQLLQGETIITTVTGFFKIYKSVVDPDDVISSNEFNALNDALKKVNADYIYVMESAQASADAAKESQIASKTSEENSKISEENASISSSNASGHAKDAKTYSESANRANQAAMESSNNATYQATQASNYAKESQSYAIGGTETRDNEDIDNSKYYYEQAKAISESFSGALRPMGTVTFANLPTVSDASEGDMYNIFDQFTTTSDFKEGSGLVIPAGSNVYKTAEGKWDILAGTPVSSVNGQTGNVEIRKNDVGLGNVGNFKAVSTVASQGLSNTEKANARANIGAGTSSFSGNYNDLSNKPTIPSVRNGTVTIKQAGQTKGTFTMNQSGNTTIELTDNNTTYTNMKAATASAAGNAGLVPAPAAGAQGKYLRGDGTWGDPISVLKNGFSFYRMELASQLGYYKITQEEWTNNALSLKVYNFEITTMENIPAWDEKIIIPSHNNITVAFANVISDDAKHAIRIMVYGNGGFKITNLGVALTKSLVFRANLVCPITE